MTETRAGWFFSEKGVNDKERDPGWDEYFSSNRSTVESFVRESIQNSLDAARLKGNPACVSIFYSGAEAALAQADYADYLSSADGQDAVAHYAAENFETPFPQLSGAAAYDEADRKAVRDWIEDVVESFVADAGFVEKVIGGVQ